MKWHSAGLLQRNIARKGVEAGIDNPIVAEGKDGTSGCRHSRRVFDDGGVIHPHERSSQRQNARRPAADHDIVQINHRGAAARTICPDVRQTGG